MSLTLISHVTKCTHFLRFTNLAFFQEFFQRGGKIYCYANFFCYANFSIVFRPNFGERGQKSLREGGKLPQQDAPCGKRPANCHYVGDFTNSFVNPCIYSMKTRPCFPSIEPFIFSFPKRASQAYQAML